MKTYPSKQIRNVALVGPGSSGKTMLAEALLYRAGAISRLGRIETANTVCDFEPEEQESGSSQTLTLASFEWNGHKINLLDTPGYLDFMGEQWAALTVADLAVIVVDAASGVDHGLLGAWRKVSEWNVPRIFFVNKLDREHASFSGVIDSLRDTFGSGIAPLEVPVGEGENFSGLVDLLSEVAWL